MSSTRTTRNWYAVARMVALDAAVVLTGIVVYFGTRGLTAGNPEVARDHARDILALEKTLGLDVEAGVQAALVHVEAVTTVANWVYIWGHWPAIAITLVWLALYHRTVFLRLRNAMIASGAMGLCVYTTYPVAPPRLLDPAYVDTVTEQSRAYRVLQPPAFVNQYAAMPSLHVGWDLVLGMAIVAAASTLLLRTIGRLMPVVMASATVLTANHYILDVIAGAAFGLAGWMVALWFERRREARSAGRAGTSVEPVPSQRAAPPAEREDVRPAPERPAPARDWDEPHAPPVPGRPPATPSPGRPPATPLPGQRSRPAASGHATAGCPRRCAGS